MTENNSAVSESLELATFIAQVIDDKQGQDIIVLPVGEVLGITNTSLSQARQTVDLFVPSLTRFSDQFAMQLVVDQ